MNSAEQQAFRGNNPRDTAALRAWHAAAPHEEALEPGLPIVDTHHHLYGRAGDALHYRLEDLREDMPGGHNLLATVYVAAYFSGWRTSGPQQMRPVGEVEFIAGLTRDPIPHRYGSCQLAAGIVSYADLCLGDEVVAVLEAQQAAGDGRLRGVRHQAARVGGVVGSLLAHPPEWQLLANPAFRRGAAQLARHGLSFDAWVYHPQLPELVAFADALPQLPIVVNHAGGLIGVAEFRQDREAALAQWRAGLRALALRPNVSIKIGGLGLPLLGFGFEHGERPASSRQLARAWQPTIDACIEAFGPARCLFESNFPVDKQSCSYTALWNACKLATRALSPDERSDLFHRTASRVYRLPQPIPRERQETPCTAAKS